MEFLELCAADIAAITLEPQTYRKWDKFAPYALRHGNICKKKLMKSRAQKPGQK